MPTSFHPPGIKSLFEIDDPSAGDEYSDEPIVIQGVVGPKIQYGWPEYSDGYVVHIFTLAA